MDAEDILKIVGALSALVVVMGGQAVLIIQALNKQTGEIKKGNEQAAVADTKKIALSEKIAEPVVPLVAVVPEPPDWTEILKGIQELTVALKQIPPRG